MEQTVSTTWIPGVVEEVSRVVVGQRIMIERTLVGLLTGGHVLLEGLPGLAKTLCIKTLAQTLQVQFQRVQFTPDLLPSDLIGTMVYNQNTGQFTARKGPIFTNILLADEINRAPAKVQSALLEAMGEQQVTIGETTHRLTDPFLVLATQNPIEQEGTYNLPEAQLDRFMLFVKVGYPTLEEEKQILERMGGVEMPKARPIIQQNQIMEARADLEKIYVDPKIKDYILRIVFATREPARYNLKKLESLIRVGCSPRATLSLYKAARAHALIRGRAFATPDDIKAIGPDVLRHRLVLSYEAEAENMTSDHIISEIFRTLEVP
jgi:MoxR-like ATPase